MEKSCPCPKNLRNIHRNRVVSDLFCINEIFRQNIAKIIQILRLYNTIQYTPGPQNSPHRVDSGSGTGSGDSLDTESIDLVPDPETLPI